MERIIFLNGPPGCGKNTVAEMMMSGDNGGAIVCGFADTLKQATMRFYGLDDADPFALEPIKDDPSTDFGGLTPRQCMQWISEAAKIAHGLDYWGLKMRERLLHEQRTNNVRRAYIADSGFPEEAKPLVDRFGVQQCTLVHIIGREGTRGDNAAACNPARGGETFAGDTRSYWTLPGLDALTLYNETTLSDLRERVDLLMSTFVK